jgi:ribA/ribD-fused uncharacterized protein
MPPGKRTYRIDGEERIEGTWRHVFIHNGPAFYLADLIVYADGAVDCWGLVPFPTFVEKVRNGWVATNIPDGAAGSAHHVGAWTFTNPRNAVSPEMLIGEVADEIAQLQGQPTSDRRCEAALDTYLSEPTEENRVRLAAAYEEIPAHMRRYVLGDQDNKDAPLRILLARVGERYGHEGGAEGRVVTPEVHERALAYFADRKARRLTPEQRDATDDPDNAGAPASSVLRFDKHDGGLPFLASGADREFEYRGVTYRTVDHAYWSLSTDDETARSAIRVAPTAYEASKLGKAASRRPGWPSMRLAVMLELLRAKYHQHADLAELLLQTGDARLSNGVDFSTYWGTNGQRGRNWLGRLLEVVRSELWIERHGK